jgi:hypothetical protein
MRPHNHYDASIKASRLFNSTPTFPGIDFGCGSLLSFCVYCQLETPQLPAAPRQYGNRPSVLAQPGFTMTRHLTYATSCRTSELITSNAQLDYIAVIFHKKCDCVDETSSTYSHGPIIKNATERIHSATGLILSIFNATGLTIP